MNATKQSRAYTASIASDGFTIADNVLTHGEVDSLLKALAALVERKNDRQLKGVYGIRNLMELSPEVAELARSSRVRSLVTPILGDGCFAVRATYFNKLPDANWKVPWHQDTAILVRGRIETEGFSAWSEKAGALHVQPPESVLRGMLAIRVHLDDCFSENGPLKVLRGSHKRRWPFDQIDKAKTDHQEVVCEVAKGGAVALRPLLLHASSPSQSPGHRRVVHLEYAATALPNGLDWRSGVGRTIT